MLEIPHQSITSSDGKPIGVILDINTFQKIESIIENYGLAHFMNEGEDDELIDRENAIKLYQSIIAGQNNG